MPITAVQIEQRKARLGSSDMAALLGFDPRRNAYDLWLEKTGKLVEGNNGNEAMYAGNMFEDGVLKFAEKELGKLTRNQFRSAKDLGFPLGANIDGLLVSTGEPIEAKTAGLYGPLTEPWGEALTDQVPDRVIIQATVHMICTIKMVCHVPAFLGGRGFQRYAVPFDQDVADAIKNEGYTFWNNHVLTDIPPTNVIPNLAVIKRFKREAAKTVPVDKTIIDRWRVASDVRKTADKQEKEYLAAILAALGDAEAGECEFGTFTYLEQTRAAYEVPESTYRVARFKKAK